MKRGFGHGRVRQKKGAEEVPIHVSIDVNEDFRLWTDGGKSKEG